VVERDEESGRGDEVAEEVSGDIRRKQRARREGRRSVWFGLGMFGLVGWSIALPTLLGVMLGIWLDRRFGTGLTWTAALLLAGIALGCWNAWRWIQDERPTNDDNDTEE
jgi:ATP synthase protein I